MSWLDTLDRKTVNENKPVFILYGNVPKLIPEYILEDLRRERKLEFQALKEAQCVQTREYKRLKERNRNTTSFANERTTVENDETMRR